MKNKILCQFQIYNVVDMKRTHLATFAKDIVANVVTQWVNFLLFHYF